MEEFKPKLNNEFSSFDFIDIKVIVHKDSGFINYSRLCKDLKTTTVQSCFKKLINSNQKIWDIIMLYECKNELKYKPRNIQTLVDLGIFKIFINGVSPKYFGTYGPSYLFNYIVMNTNIGYYKYINSNEFIGNLNNVELVKLEYEKQRLRLENEITQLKSIIKKYNSSNLTGLTGIEFGYE